MKVLITGGAGYIGSHIVTQLIEANYDVLVYDNLSSGFKGAVHSSASLIEGDVRDTAQLSQVVAAFKPDAVIHMAAKLSVPESLSKPIDYYDNNVNGMISLLSACSKNSVKKIVFSSTAAVYGNSNLSGVYSEASLTAPLNPYGASKLFSERILQDAEASTNIKHVILRYFNVAGARPDGTNGQRTTNSTQLIKRTAEVASGKLDSISIFGDDYNTPDRTCIRDYIHVEDLAQIHIQALKYLEKADSKSEIINCGYGKGYSVKEIIETMRKVSNVRFTAKLEARRAGDAETAIADNSKLRHLFPNWTPQFNNLDLICKSAFDWESKGKYL